MTTVCWLDAVARGASTTGAGTAAAWPELALALQAVVRIKDARRIHAKRAECVCISTFLWLGTMQVFWQIGVAGGGKVSEQDLRRSNQSVARYVRPAGRRRRPSLVSEPVRSSFLLFR